MSLYLVFVFYFAYMAIDVLLRNPRKTEHRLISLISLCYLLLFLSEYIRYQLPIAYSPAIASFWFANAGIAIPGLGFHFMAKFSGMDRRMPKWIYPYIFYVPMLIIPVNLISSSYGIAIQQFEAVRIWKYPIYDAAYYIAMTGSILNSLLYFIPLVKGKRNAATSEHRAIFNWLMWGVAIVAAWHAVFGYFRFDGQVPPYAYIYGGIIWCALLRYAMRKYAFLDYTSKRYEKLFNLNPVAVMLVGITGRIKEANPSARRLFSNVHLARAGLRTIAGEGLARMIQGRQPIRAFETAMYNGPQQAEVLLDGDYVTMDNEVHVVLMIQDITEQRHYQQEAAFLASHDVLTRLLNRAMFQERLAGFVKQVAASQSQLAVIVVAVEHMQTIINRYGYAAGDEAALHAAHALEAFTGPNSFGGRLAEGEFALAICPLPSATYVRETIIELKGKLAAHSFGFRDDAPKLAFRIGAGYYPQDGADASTLLARAKYTALKGDIQ